MGEHKPHSELENEWLLALGDPTDGGLHPTELPYETWLEKKLLLARQRVAQLELNVDRLARAWETGNA